MANKGLTKEQTDRVLEDFQSATMAIKLLMQILEQIGRDIMGMRNGNKKEGK